MREKRNQWLQDQTRNHLDSNRKRTNEVRLEAMTELEFSEATRLLKFC
jgi:hypothetical protein